jgi:hypothetical protein
MTSSELRTALDGLGLSDGEAAQLLYITPNVLSAYLLGQRKIPGPMVAAIEAWQRHGPPPGAKLVTEGTPPKTLKLMRDLRDSLAEGTDDTPAPKRPKKKKS